MADISQIFDLTYRLATPSLSDITPHPENRPIDQQVVKELAESIRNDGLGQLPTCRLMPDGKYQLIAGEHRWRAYQLLAEKNPDVYGRMPIAYLEDISDERALVLMLITNIHTSPLNSADQAAAYQRLGVIVNEQRRVMPGLKGVPTGKLIADVIKKETGKSVSASSINKALKAGKDKEKKDKALTPLLPYLDPSWRAESSKLPLEVVEIVSSKKPHEQKALWREAQEKDLFGPGKKGRLEYYLINMDDSGFEDSRQIQTLDARLDSVLKALSPAITKADAKTLKSCRNKAAEINRLIKEITPVEPEKELPVFEDIERQQLIIL